MTDLARFGVELPTLSAVDVGSHGGLSDHWKAFQSNMEIDCFDPDAEDCARQQRTAPRNLRFHPVGLARTSGRHNLYVLNRPTGSSLYPPNSELLSRYSDESYWGLRKTIEIDCLSLQDFLDREKRPAPNLIKLDTQGSEMDILSGLAEASWSSVIAVETEVEFHELYKGQPLFCDVNRFMTGHGYDLLDLRTHRAYRCRNGVESYYLRKHWNFERASDEISAQLVAGDALYLRPMADSRVIGSKQTLLQYWLVTLIYHYYELSLIALEEGERRGLLTPREAARLRDATLEAGPRPRLAERNDLVGGLVRRVQARLGKRSEYRTFWTVRCLPDQ